MDVADVAAVAKLPEQLAASAAEFADVDILVNNAGLALGRVVLVDPTLTRARCQRLILKYDGLLQILLLNSACAATAGNRLRGYQQHERCTLHGGSEHSGREVSPRHTVLSTTFETTLGVQS